MAGIPTTLTTCWVHLEMPTMIIVACSWVSSIRNSVGNRLWPTVDFLTSLAFSSMIDLNQRFPTILNVATTINFWLGWAIWITSFTCLDETTPVGSDGGTILQVDVGWNMENTVRRTKHLQLSSERNFCSSHQRIGWN